MLYTARPLERIFASPSVFSNTKPRDKNEEDNAEYREVILPSGRIVARREGENYVIEHISSTDMKDYLNEDYYPGNNVKNK